MSYDDDDDHCDDDNDEYVCMMMMMKKTLMKMMMIMIIYDFSSCIYITLAQSSRSAGIASRDQDWSSQLTG